MSNESLDSQAPLGPTGSLCHGRDTLYVVVTILFVVKCTIYKYPSKLQHEMSRTRLMFIRKMTDCKCKTK